MSWSHEQVETLIDNYQKWPCLYMIKSAEYKNKHARSCAMQAVEAALKTVRPLTNTLEIKTKLQGLKTNFYNEHKKVEASKHSGAGEETVYHPSLWYYEKLLFLLEHNIVRKATDTIEQNVDEAIDDNVEDNSSSNIQEYYVDEESNIHYTVADIEGDHDSIITTLSQSQSRSASANLSSNLVKRKKKIHTDSADKVFEQASSSLNLISNAFTSLQNPHVVPPKGSEEIFGAFVVSKLKCIENADLKTNVEIEIINLLYNALQHNN